MGALPVPGQALSASNGVYKFDRAYKWLILIAGSFGFLLILGALIRGQINHEDVAPRFIVLAFLELTGLVAAVVYVERRANRTLQISDQGISIRDNQGNETSGIRWFELGRVSERRVMGRLVLWDQSGRERVVVDQQFEPSAAVRARILDEYARVFTPRPLPVEFKNPNPLNTQSLLMGLITVFFLSMAFMANRQGSSGAAAFLAAFALLGLYLLLNLNPQLRGPSVLFEDRLVLRTLFRQREFFKKDVTSIELQDVANQTGTKFSLVLVKALGGKQAKITFVYGNIPDIYLTLKAWLAR